MAKKKSGRAVLKKVEGQPSWRIASSSVEAFVTEQGGHLAPVTFDLQGRRIQPYSIAHWARKPDPALPGILQSLRGDFFCLPFGANDRPWHGERHELHGEPANSDWKFESLTHAAGRNRLHLSLDTTIRPAHVDKEIILIDGHNAVYSRHTVSGGSGPTSVGHHATLKFPDSPGSGIVSTSPFVHGEVFVEPTERPEARGYSALKPGATFTSLEHVPTVFGTETDISRYPARRGYEDLALLVNDPDGPFAWTAVTFPRERYVWFALKDPRVLHQTLFWMSNGGRHYAPWSSRHVNVMGLEEITGYFAYGLSESAGANPHSKAGYATSVKLSPKQPLVVNYIMAVAAIPAGFDRVARIEPGDDSQSVALRSASGKTVKALLDIGFLHSALEAGHWDKE